MEARLTSGIVGPTENLNSPAVAGDTCSRWPSGYDVLAGAAVAAEVPALFEFDA